MFYTIIFNYYFLFQYYVMIEKIQVKVWTYLNLQKSLISMYINI